MVAYARLVVRPLSRLVKLPRVVKRPKQRTAVFLAQLGALVEGRVVLKLVASAVWLPLVAVVFKPLLDLWQLVKKALLEVGVAMVVALLVMALVQVVLVALPFEVTDW